MLRDLTLIYDLEQALTAAGYHTVFSWPFYSLTLPGEISYLLLCPQTLNARSARVCTLC